VGQLDVEVNGSQPEFLDQDVRAVDASEGRARHVRDRAVKVPDTNASQPAQLRHEKVPQAVVRLRAARARIEAEVAVRVIASA
jgi:hypothetical protein